MLFNQTSLSCNTRSRRSRPALARTTSSCAALGWCARTRRERQAEKEGVAAQRRAIKKSARQHLKQQLATEADEIL
jgi:hypothetical protein